VSIPLRASVLYRSGPPRSGHLYPMRTFTFSVRWAKMAYIVRRTCGFRKLADAISLTQFQHGICH